MIGKLVVSFLLVALLFIVLVLTVWGSNVAIDAGGIPTTT